MSGNVNDEEEGPCTNGKQFDGHPIIFESPHVDRLRTFEYRNHKAIGKKIRSLITTIENFAERKRKVRDKEVKGLVADATSVACMLT